MDSKSRRKLDKLVAAYNQGEDQQQARREEIVGIIAGESGPRRVVLEGRLWSNWPPADRPGEVRQYRATALNGLRHKIKQVEV